MYDVVLITTFKKGITMNYKIVSDSSSNLTSYPEVDFDSVPLHIIVGTKDFVDKEGVDLPAMLEALSKQKGPSSTSCPSPEDWLNAFGEADAVFCVTITSKLSGSFQSANTAKQMYEEQHPDRKVFLIDSLSTGPHMVLLIEKLAQLIKEDRNPEEIYNRILDYHKHTRLFFSLASVNNLAKNGRINSLLAFGIGALGIRIVGEAFEGTLKPRDKGRGDKKALNLLLKHMEENGYKGGKVHISHTGNPEAAKMLKNMITEKYGAFPGNIYQNTALCSYYAEPLSVLLAFETK